MYVYIYIHMPVLVVVVVVEVKVLVVVLNMPGWPGGSPRGNAFVDVLLVVLYCLL